MADSANIPTARPTGIPRLSRLPIPKAAAPKPAPKPATTQQIPLRPKPSIDAIKTRQPASNSRRISTTPSQPATFKRPAKPPVPRFPRPTSQTSQTSQTKSSTSRTRNVARNSIISTSSTIKTEGDDTLGDLDSFRSASRASSRAGFRSDDTPIEAPHESPEAPEIGVNTRLSLAERAVESISKLPPTPAKRRRSSFFNPDSPMAPRPSSAVGVRSWGDQDDMPPVPKTPALTRLQNVAGTSRSRQSVGPGNAAGKRSVSTAQARPSLAGTKPTSTTKPAAKRPLGGSKTVAARPTKPRPALAGVFNGPNDAPTPKDGKPKPPANAAKSSSALRDQIRAAKAAKKSLSERPEGSDVAIVPDSTGFEADLNDDPFNLQPKGGKLVMRRRVDTARSEGRLNIAGMSLKEIPEEVLKMYDYEYNKDQSGIAWGEVMNLTKFIAADNELESIPGEVFPDIDMNNLADDDDSLGPQFGGLEHLDLHGNLLFDVPPGLRRLTQLTSLNLSRNQLMNDSFETIAQISSLKELRITDNALTGELSSSISNLTQLEVLEVQGNKLISLPAEIGELIHLRILNISNNQIDSLPMESLAKTSLVSLNAMKNHLSGTLFTDANTSMPRLQSLDVSVNSLIALSYGPLTLPSLKELNINYNRITSLPPMSDWTSLMTLYAEDNKISTIPEGFTSLSGLRTVDFTGNDFSRLDSLIGTMEGLRVFKIGANPIRERKFMTMSIDDLKRDLKARLGLDEPGTEL
ncbi:L domain-like protein, partial [Microthyrium microscopicum]